MAGFRSVSYKITGATEDEIVGLIFRALDAIDVEFEGMIGCKPDFGTDRWRGYTDGYWRGFIRNDSCGITLQLIYHFPYTFTYDSGPVTLNMIWSRPGIKSKFFPKRQVNSLISKWQSAIEEKFRMAGLNYKQEYQY